MPQFTLSRLFSWGTPSRQREARRPRGPALNLEVLEDRVTPSAGHGVRPPAVTPPAAKSGHVAPQSPAVTSSGKSGRGASSSPARAFKLDDTAPPIKAGVLVSELFSGYPLPPSVGPGLKNDALVLSNPSAWPFPMQNSTVAVVPVMLVSAPAAGAASSAFTLVLRDATTGATYSVPVTVVPAPGGTVL